MVYYRANKTKPDTNGDKTMAKNTSDSTISRFKVGMDIRDKSSGGEYRVIKLYQRTSPAINNGKPLTIATAHQLILPTENMLRIAHKSDNPNLAKPRIISKKINFITDGCTTFELLEANNNEWESIRFNNHQMWGHSHHHSSAGILWLFSGGKYW